MAQTPQAPVKQPESHSPPATQHKVVGEAGALVMPVAEPAVGKPTPTIGVKGEPIEDGERDPVTIAEEQRRRSKEYEDSMVPPPPAEETRKTPAVQHQTPQHQTPQQHPNTTRR